MAEPTDTDRRLLDLAYAEAQAGLAEGGLPIGSVLATASGEIVARGRNRRVQDGDPTAHAEVTCVRAAGRRRDWASLTLVSTLSPCAMCTGTSLLFNVRRVVIGESTTFAGPEHLFRAAGVEVIPVEDLRCVEMMRAFSRRAAGPVVRGHRPMKIPAAPGLGVGEVREVPGEGEVPLGPGVGFVVFAVDASGPLDDATLEVAVRGSGSFGPWLAVLGEGREDADGDRVVVDLLGLRVWERAQAVRVRSRGLRSVTLGGAGGGTSFADPADAAEVALDVPFFTQRRLPKAIAGRTCCPTSLAMVLAFHGIDRSPRRCRGGGLGPGPRDLRQLAPHRRRGDRGGLPRRGAAGPVVVRRCRLAEGQRARYRLHPLRNRGTPGRGHAQDRRPPRGDHRPRRPRGCARARPGGPTWRRSCARCDRLRSRVERDLDPGVRAADRRLKPRKTLTVRGVPRSFNSLLPPDVFRENKELKLLGTGFASSGLPYSDMEPSGESRIVSDGITFDDVLLLPSFSDFVPGDADTSAPLTRGLTLNVPLVSAPMDTVTESALAIGLAQEGGFGVIHKNLSVEAQAREVTKVKRSANGVIPDPLVLPPEAKASEARALMRTQNISGVPVTEGGVRNGLVVGIVTRRDMLFLTDDDTPLSEVMSTDLVRGEPGTTLPQAESILKDKKVEKLLLVDARRPAHRPDHDERHRQAGPLPAGLPRRPRPAAGRCRGGGPPARARGGAARRRGRRHLRRLRPRPLGERAPERPRHQSRLPRRAGHRRQRRHGRGDARDLIEAGVDAVKVGIGPGSICTTRIVSGVGVPQITAIFNAIRAATPAGVPSSPTAASATPATSPRLSPRAPAP